MCPCEAAGGVYLRVGALYGFTEALGRDGRFEGGASPNSKLTGVCVCVCVCSMVVFF